MRSQEDIDKINPRWEGNVPKCCRHRGTCVFFEDHANDAFRKCEFLGHYSPNICEPAVEHKMVKKVKPV